MNKKKTNYLILLAILAVMSLEILFYVSFKLGVINLTFNLGGGSDADYYNDFALGLEDFEVNAWTLILRNLNSLGLYSRATISYLFLFATLLIIPVITTKLASLKFHGSQKYYLYLFLICTSYPTLYFFTFDIYRDVFMVLCFLIGCLTVKKSLLSSSSLQFSLFFLISIAMGVVLIGLRPYLGGAFLMAFGLWKIRFNRKSLILLLLVYLIALFIAKYMGYLDSLTEYRSGFSENNGGSTLGLDFSNPSTFIANFILSTLGQLFGLYITNPFAAVLLFVETLPFFLMLKYVIKNIRWADSFVRFLLIFFVIYASIWLIGNDNLGTAVRLRIYNYFAIYISFFYILNLKRQQGIK